MSLLADLEKQARAAREKRARESAARASRAADAESKLRPALARAERYFKTLAGHLNDIDREIRIDVDLPGLGILKGLTQTGYRAVADEEGRQGPVVRLVMSCVGRVPLEVTLEGESVAGQHARDLKAQGLECRVLTEGGRRAVLRVEPRLPASVAVWMDREREVIVLDLRNVPAVGVHTYRLAPERIDEPLLEAVARCVLREPNDLARLTDSVVDDSQRASIRKQLAREQRRRDAELAGGLRQALFPLAEWLRRALLRR